MAFVSFVLVIALIEYFTFGMLVGQARQRYGIKAPAMTGDPVFERYVRVHHNTLEQLVIFIPAIWLFATFVSSTVAGLLGLVFIAGRIVYFQAYIADPGSRSLGFGIGLVAQAILLLGAGFGALGHWLF